ncbi:MAG: hypothetical protein AAF549_03180 [Pseudomonadota bacterium]
MIGKILDVGHVRSGMGAVWFYVLSLVLLVGISTTLVHFLGMVGAVDTSGSFFGGGEVYTLISSLFVLFVSGLILSHRKMTSDIYAVLLVGIGVYVTFTMSILLGLIPIALLTMLKK